MTVAHSEADDDGLRLGRRETAFSLAACARVAIPIVVDGESADATVTYGKDGPHDCGRRRGAGHRTPKCSTAGEELTCCAAAARPGFGCKDFSAAAAGASTGDGVIKAPMHGKGVGNPRAVGDRVTAGQRLAVIEAMKMEHTLRAPFAGTVTQVAVGIGAQVVEGAQIMVIEPDRRSDP